MEISPLKIAVLGAGSVVIKHHLPALKAVGGCAVSIFDPATKASRSAAAAFEIPKIASSAEEAIKTAGVEAVLIASPNAFHREQAVIAFQAGRHVLCEKPVCIKLTDAKAIIDASEQSGKVLQMGFHHRYSSEHLCVKRLIECGAVGDIRSFNGNISEPLEIIPGGLKNYRFDAALGGGFTLIDVGQHRIDQIRDLLGDVAEVSCEMGSFLPSHNLDDCSILTLLMQSGAIGSLNWHRFSRAFTSPLMLYGTKATLGCSAFITAPFQSAPISIYLEQDPSKILPPDILAWTRPTRCWGDLEPGWVDIWPPRTKTFEEQFRSFFKAVQQQHEPRANGMDGYNALEIVQAAYRSYEERQVVKLPLKDGNHQEPPRW